VITMGSLSGDLRDHHAGRIYELTNAIGDQGRSGQVSTRSRPLPTRRSGREKDASYTCAAAGVKRGDRLAGRVAAISASHLARFDHAIFEALADEPLGL